MINIGQDPCHPNDITTKANRGKRKAIDIVRDLVHNLKQHPDPDIVEAIAEIINGKDAVHHIQGQNVENIVIRMTKTHDTYSFFFIAYCTFVAKLGICKHVTNEKKKKII